MSLLKEPCTEKMPNQPVAVRLSLWDTVSIIVGIIIGVGIYETPGEVFHLVARPWEALALWVVAGILSLVGALCWAELGSTYPRSGGEYVYLTRAYGPGLGFLFAWAQLVLLRTGGGIAAPAYVFADTARSLGGLEPWAAALLACAVIAALTVLNILGTVPGKRTQNLLTLVKVLSLGGIILAGLWAVPAESVAATPSPPNGDFSIAAALVLVLYSYDGWNEAAYVSREVHDYRRNLPRALILGTTLVMVIYLLINLAYLHGLGFEGARGDQTAATLLTRTLGQRGGLAMSVLVMVSVLGAINGMVFTGSRIFSELGADHPILAPLGRWHPRWQTPIWSLVTQAVLSMMLVLAAAGLGDPKNGFRQLVEWTAPVFWLFFLLTGVALFVLRVKDPDIERPFRVPWYPVLPIVFCAWAAYMFAASLSRFQWPMLGMFGVLLAGVPLYLLTRR